MVTTCWEVFKNLNFSGVLGYTHTERDGEGGKGKRGRERERERERYSYMYRGASTTLPPGIEF